MGSIYNIIAKEREYANIPYTEKGSSNNQKFSDIVDNAGLMGCQNEPWCATYQFAMELEEFGKKQALKNWNMTAKNYCGYSVFETRDKFRAAGKTGSVPKIGALVIFSQSHIGRVLSINEKDKTFECGEGNTSNAKYDRNGNACAVKTYKWSDAKIVCFCYIEYDMNKDYLSRGDTGEKVIDMQTKPIACGYSCGKYGADGDFGADTEEAVRKFQKDNELTVDGLFGGQSSKTLDEIYSSVGDSEKKKEEKPEKTEVKKTPESKENVTKGQEYLNNTYSTVVIMVNRHRLKVDGIYGGESRNATVCVWKSIANKKFDANLTTSNVNFLSASKVAAEKMMIQCGDAKDEVYLLKFVLAGFGYFAGNMNKEFCEDLKDAVCKWQTNHNLEVDGICGAETWYSLFNDFD